MAPSHVLASLPCVCCRGVRCGQVSLSASDGVQASARLPPCTQIMLLFALTKHRVQAGQKHQDRQAVPAALPSCTSVPVNFHHFPAEYKLGKNIKIAMLYLEDEDAVSAEQYIKKASSLLSACKVRGRCDAVSAEHCIMKASKTSPRCCRRARCGGSGGGGCGPQHSGTVQQHRCCGWLHWCKGQALSIDQAVFK